MLCSTAATDLLLGEDVAMLIMLTNCVGDRHLLNSKFQVLPVGYQKFREMEGCQEHKQGGKKTAAFSTHKAAFNAAI